MSSKDQGHVDVILTCLTSGTSRRRRWRSTSDIVHGYHVELVLRVGTQCPDHIVHGDDSANLAEGLVGVLRLVLDHIILQVLGTLVRPLQTHRSGGHLGYLHIGGCGGKCCKMEWEWKNIPIKLLSKWLIVSILTLHFNHRNEIDLAQS